MTAAPHPRMHGLTHVKGGPDPIPGLLPPPAGTFSDWAVTLTGVWAYWPLQDASGNAVDQGPTHADMQPIGTPAYHAAGPNSTDLRYAVRLTGARASSISDDSFFNTADNLAVGGHSEFTAMCWIKPDSGAATTSLLPIIGTWDVFRTGWTFHIQPLSGGNRLLEFDCGNGTSTANLVGPPVTMNAWSLVAVTRDATAAAKMYVNGSLVATHPSFSPLGSSGHGIRLGAVDLSTTDPDSYFFYGNMAGAVWVDHALTGGEILQGYNALAGGDTAGWVLTLDPDGNPVWAPAAGGGSLLWEDT